MTTIAWDGKMLAADRRVSYGNCSDHQRTKIYRRGDGALCGAVGQSSRCAAFTRWFLSGEQGERPAMGEKSDAVHAIIVGADGVLTIHDEAGWFEVEAQFTAIGSGCDYALGAMAMGADAGDAVRTAIRFDGLTGGAVDVLWGESERQRQQSEDTRRVRWFATDPAPTNGIVVEAAENIDAFETGCNTWPAQFWEGQWWRVSVSPDVRFDRDACGKAFMMLPRMESITHIEPKTFAAWRHFAPAAHHAQRDAA